MGWVSALEPGVLSVALSGTAGVNDVTLDGGEASGNAGFSISEIGDFNGDGEPDFIVGAYREDGYGGTDSGVTYLVLGGAWLGTLTGPLDLDETQPNVVGIFGETQTDFAGRSVSAAGDVNGDGLDDLVIGAYRADGSASNAGAAYIVLGTPSLGWGIFLSGVRAGVHGVAIDGEAASDYAGFSVDGAGDFNGDGLDDIVLGAYAADPNGLSTAGKAYVVFGQSSWGESNPNLSLAGLAASGHGAEISGEHVGGYLGYSVAGAGDFNGDGLDDVVVGARRAPGWSTAYAGRAYVVYGRSAGLDIDVGAVNPDITEVIGTGGYDYLGYSVSGGGDFNRDGYADVVIGAPYADGVAGSNIGEAFVIFGGDFGSQARPTTKYIGLDRGVAFEGENAGDLFGIAVAMGGDFNLDGLGDVLFGATGADPMGSGSGAAYVAYGADDPAISDQPVLAVDLEAEVGGLVFDGEEVGDSAGRSVAFSRALAGGQDVMVAVGAHGADPNGSASGRTYLTRPDPLPGTYYALNRAPDTTPDVYYAAQGQLLSVAAPGVLENDVDHDGDPVVVLEVEETTASGCVVRLHADGSFYVTPPTSTWWGTCAVPYTADDGSGGQRTESLTVVYALSDLSVADLVSAGAGQVWNGEAAGDGVGLSVDVVADVDADGRDELWVGAYGVDTMGPWSGAGYLVYGEAAAAENELASVAPGVGGFMVEGEAAFDWLGLAVASAGDSNGDGEPELLIGAIGQDSQGERTGRVYQFDPSGLSAVSPWSVGQAGSAGFNGVVYDGEAEQHDAGRALGDAGDLNGDGIADVFMSSYRAHSTEVDMDGAPVAEQVGVVHVVFGNNGILMQDMVDLADIGGAIPGVRIEGVADGDYAGFSAAAAGDLNADGAQDFIIGAYGADTMDGGVDSGRVYVVYGSGALPSVIDLADIEQNVGGLGITLDGGEPYELAGRVVAGLGDINADGVDDVLIGAPGADAGTGCAYVVFGASGLGGAEAHVALPDLLANNAGIILHGVAAGDGLGSAGVGLGDFNADGVADFSVGAPLADAPDVFGAGRVYVVLGGADLTSQYLPVADIVALGYGFAVSGAQAGGALGSAVAGGGDINGDGLDDLLVGAFEVTPVPDRDEAGAAYVVFGHDAAVGLGDTQ